VGRAPTPAPGRAKLGSFPEIRKNRGSGSNGAIRAILLQTSGKKENSTDELVSLLSPPHPAPFFEVRLQFLDRSPGLTAVCAGYELGHWRKGQLAGHLIKWLPEFALTYSELKRLEGPHNAADLIAKAARTVYMSDKYKKRGEIGELLLHVICREIFKTYPAITKYFYKDSANNTVKGFDAVHVIVTETGLELWLGESKFYKDIGEAINSAVADLKAHTERNYLRSEFMVIQNMLDRSWPYADRLEKLIHQNVSLDQIFEAVCIPVLLTYESTAISAHAEVSAEFLKAFKEEVKKHYEVFSGKNPLTHVRVHLFLFPAKDKDGLLAEFDSRLKACQSII
jgi:hypothetical protein